MYKDLKLLINFSLKYFKSKIIYLQFLIIFILFLNQYFIISSQMLHILFLFLNVDANPALEGLHCGDNQLTSLVLKLPSQASTISCYNQGKTRIIK